MDPLPPGRARLVAGPRGQLDTTGQVVNVSQRRELTKEMHRTTGGYELAFSPLLLALVGFGIDKETRFWEIKQSVSRERELRCGLKDCSHPMGSFSEQANLYLTLAGRDERSALKKFNISESPAP